MQHNSSRKWPHPTEAAVPGHKKCHRCEQLRPISEFQRRHSESKELYAYCLSCRREYFREYQRKRRAKDSVGAREAERERRLHWTEQRRKKEREQDREYREKRKQDPEKQQKYLEYQREYAKKRRYRDALDRLERIKAMPPEEQRAHFAKDCSRQGRPRLYITRGEQNLARKHGFRLRGAHVIKAE